MLLEEGLLQDCHQHRKSKADANFAYLFGTIQTVLSLAPLDASRTAQGHGHDRDDPDADVARMEQGYLWRENACTVMGWTRELSIWSNKG